MAGKVYVNFNDGSSAWLDSGSAAKAVANKDGRVASKVRMRVVTENGNTITRDFSGARVPPQWQDQGSVVEPGDAEVKDTSLLGSLANDVRGSAASVLPTAGAMAPFAIPGAGFGPAAARVVAGFFTGAGADAGSRALSHMPQNPAASMTAGAINAGGQLVGEAAPVAVRAMARPLAKGALPGSLPGTEDILLKARTPVSQSGMEADQKFIDEMSRKARNTSFKSDKRFSARALEAEMERLRNTAARSDMLSEDTEQGLDAALKVMREKLYRYYDVSPPGEVGHGKRPVKLTADQVDDINQFAEKQAKKLYEARTKNKVSDPSPLESAYMRIAKITNGMLNTIPEVRALNAQASERIKLKDAKFEALKRGPSRLLPLVAGEGVAQAAFSMTHNPASLLTGVPAAALTYAASTPEGMSRLALGASSPYLESLLRSTPRMAAAAANSFLRKQQ